MAGVDYMKCNIDLEKWERCRDEQPPSYLLAEKMIPRDDEILENDGDKVVRARIQEWAKAVASMRSTAPCFEIRKINIHS
ncbi:hypothetical protein Acr_05g0010590 [Actinidia rufa]|uniref:Uncharacterized protein n=1 Tax=Actinidia rufa TaxID=165716 RepID=A0A7J0ELZ9_9ERIC|nr:hypothetical protein Acr_05g0010590 [Actinidia rufa]